MDRTFLWFVSLAFALWTATVSASPGSEQARACVAASTRGQSERDEGQLLAAREQLLVCAGDSCPSIVRKHCEAWLSDVDQRIPSVVIRVLEAPETDVLDAGVWVDGEPAALDGRPVLLDPGVHDVVVSAPGREPVERRFLLAEREKARLLRIELPARELPTRSKRESRPFAAEPSPAAAREPRFTVPTGAWLLGSGGVVALGAFTYLGVRASNELDELERTCAPDCTAAQRRAGENLALAADAFLTVGVASVIGAGAWSLGKWLRGRRSHGVHVVLLPTPRGTFGALRGRY